MLYFNNTPSYLQVHPVILSLGGVTILWALPVWWLLPNPPTHARFLTDRENYIAIERLRSDQSGVSADFRIGQLKEALLDLKSVSPGTRLVFGPLPSPYILILFLVDLVRSSIFDTGPQRRQRCAYDVGLWCLY